MKADKSKTIRKRKCPLCKEELGKFLINDNTEFTMCKDEEVNAQTIAKKKANSKKKVKKSVEDLEDLKIQANKKVDDQSKTPSQESSSINENDFMDELNKALASDNLDNEEQNGMNKPDDLVNPVDKSHIQLQYVNLENTFVNDIKTALFTQDINEQIDQATENLGKRQDSLDTQSTEELPDFDFGDMFESNNKMNFEDCNPLDGLQDEIDAANLIFGSY